MGKSVGEVKIERERARRLQSNWTRDVRPIFPLSHNRFWYFVYTAQSVSRTQKKDSGEGEREESEKKDWEDCTANTEVLLLLFSLVVLSSSSSPFWRWNGMRETENGMKGLFTRGTQSLSNYVPRSTLGFIFSLLVLYRFWGELDRDEELVTELRATKRMRGSKHQNCADGKSIWFFG